MYVFITAKSKKKPINSRKISTTENPAIIFLNITRNFLSACALFKKKFMSHKL